MPSHFIEREVKVECLLDKLMKEKDNNKSIDKNFFKEMNYEIAAENGVIDNEDMKNNRRLNEKKSKKENANQKQNDRK